MNASPSILLLHGFKSTSSSYFLPNLRERYEKNFSVFAPDLPSPDAPHVDEWTAVIQALPASDFRLIVAHSLGGALAWSMLSRGLIRCDTLVVIGASPCPKENVHMNTFLDYPLHFPTIRSFAKNTIVVQSLDDPWNEFETSLVALRLSKGTAMFYADKGHFEMECLPEDVLQTMDRCTDTP